jgi:hypothetical protein
MFSVCQEERSRMRRETPAAGAEEAARAEEIAAAPARVEARKRRRFIKRPDAASRLGERTPTPSWKPLVSNGD